MQSIRMKIVLSLALGIFLISLPGLGHAGPKTPVKNTKPATATTSEKPAMSATPAVNQNVNSWGLPPDKASSEGTTKNSKTEFKKYREALLAQHLLDKIISVGSRLKLKSDEFSISNKLRETIVYRNELARDLAILAGINTMTQVNTDSFVAGQEGIDPGTVSMPSMPSFSPPAIEYGCGAQQNDCNDRAYEDFNNCHNNCGSYALPSCYSNCSNDAAQDTSDCRDQKSRCDECKKGGGSNEDCTGQHLTVTHDIEELINRLLGYLDMINEVIDMQNFKHEFSFDAIGMYNNVVDMTRQMIPQQ